MNPSLKAGPRMLEQDRDPVLTICLLAAQVDGARSPEEQAQFDRIVARVGGGSAVPGMSLADAVRRISSPEAGRLAYEMAVSVVYADGEAGTAERTFLEELKLALDSARDGLHQVDSEALALAQAPLAPEGFEVTAERPVPQNLLVSQAGMPAFRPDALLDTMIRKQAMLTGALELLPQNIASLAIIPLQMRLVYRIGADYGQKLDAGQIRDLLGAMGIGAAAQVFDGMTRRIIGGLGRGIFGSVLGGVVGGTAGMAAGAALSFVTTYALGHAAKEYYEQGRHLSREDLAALFQRFKSEAEALLPQVQEQIHLQSQHLDLSRLLATIKG